MVGRDTEVSSQAVLDGKEFQEEYSGVWRETEAMATFRRLWRELSGEDGEPGVGGGGGSGW